MKKYCSFCGKAEQEVLQLFGEVSLKVFICNRCVESAVFQMHRSGIAPFRHMIQPNVVPFSPTPITTEGGGENG